MALPWACSPNSNSNPAGPVTIVQLVTATSTATPTVSPTVTPGGPPTATPVPPPAVTNGTFTTNENTALVLSNATLNTLITFAPSGDPLIFLFPGTPAHGTVSLTHSGFTNMVTYTPTAGFYGTDSFSYYVHDQTTLEDSKVQTMVITVVFTPTATSTPTITWTPTTTATLTLTPTPNATSCPTRTLFGPNDTTYGGSFSSGVMLFNPTTPISGGESETLWSIDVIPELTSGNSVSLQCAVYDQVTGDQLALSSGQLISGPAFAPVRFPVTPCTLIPGRTYLLACNIITATGFFIAESNLFEGQYTVSSGTSMPGNFTGTGATTITGPAPDIYAEICP